MFADNHSVSELVLLAVRDPSRVSLRDVHKAILDEDRAIELEPLDVLPALLACRQEGAIDLIRTCARYASPKEILLVIQEAIESQDKQADPVQNTLGIVALCSAVSRTKVGKRSALEICQSVLDDVASLIPSVSPLATRDDGRALLVEVAQLVQSLAVWATTAANADEARKIKNILRDLLDATVVGCVSSIQACLAVRAAERYFPRFFVKSGEGWREGVEAMRHVQLALEKSGGASPTAYSSLSDIVYLAHSTPPTDLTPSASSDLCRVLVNALRMNTLVDESLFLFFRTLTQENVILPLDLATSLCTVFSALASAHLDPTIRQLNLRLLSLTLTKLPPLPRRDVLLKLTTDEDFPQIRGPAVGLLKEAVLEALSDPTSQSPFASRELLRAFGGVLFRPNPPEFFGGTKTREELAQSLELLRLADCLGLYYVLLQRDVDNKTGVRSGDSVTSVRRSLLDPLQRFLNETTDGQERPLMALTSLQVGLDRIHGALHLLDLEHEREQ